MNFATARFRKLKTKKRASQRLFWWQLLELVRGRGGQEEHKMMTDPRGVQKTNSVKVHPSSGARTTATCDVAPGGMGGSKDPSSHATSELANGRVEGDFSYCLVRTREESPVGFARRASMIRQTRAVGSRRRRASRVLNPPDEPGVG